VKKNSPFRINLHELPRRAGEMREYNLKFPAPERIGTPLLGIDAGTELAILIKAESVDDGVLISGSVQSSAHGECGRCLEPINEEIEQNFQELFLYESRKSDNPEDDEEIFSMEGDEADIETPIRDAVILTMPLNPLCDLECEGLCSECGEKWANLPADHAHDVIDPRWKGLSGWKPE